MTTRTQICQTLPRSLARSVVKQIPRGLLLGGAILVAGCDDSAEQRKPGPTPAVPAVDRSADTPPAEPKPKRPATGSDTPATPPATDLLPTGSATDVAGVVRSYSGCYTDCVSEKKATNRETCKLTCDDAAEAAIESMPGGPSKEKFKAAAASFTSCVNSCFADKSLNSTNRATCVLTCQDAAEVAAIGK
jgi:hypothetical protein